MIFGDGKASISASGNFLDNLWTSFNAVSKVTTPIQYVKVKQDIHQIGLPSPIQAISGWEASQVGILKINFDASFVEDVNFSSTGVVVQYHDGVVLYEKRSYEHALVDSMWRSH